MSEACTGRQLKSRKLSKNGKSPEGARGGPSKQKRSRGKGKGTSTPNTVENKGKGKGEGKSPANEQATAGGKNKWAFAAEIHQKGWHKNELGKNPVSAARPEGKARASSCRGRGRLPVEAQHSLRPRLASARGGSFVWIDVHSV